MMDHLRASLALPGRAGKLLALVLLLGVPAFRAGRAAEPSPVQTLPPPVRLSLANCLQLALERHPRVGARRASLAAAVDGYRALEALRVPDCLVPELPIRRRQAAIGITAATAAVDQAEREVVYAVTRTYFTVLFARDQEVVARRVVEQLSAIQTTAQGMLKGGARDVTEVDVKRTLVVLRLAQVRQVEAEQGVRRALAALKEAVGLDPCSCIEVAPGRLPDPQQRPCKGAVIATALARRAELVMAGSFAQAAGLEVGAQATSMRRRMETFAAGSDIHAQPVQQAVRNNEYRPGAVPPEMPTLLVGPKSERVQRAHSLHARAEAVVLVTRNLIALEAEDGFLRWEQASRQAALAGEAAGAAEKMAEGLRQDLIAGQKVRVEEVVSAAVLAAQARAQHNELLHRKLLALADLERVTGGAFCAGLAELSGGVQGSGIRSQQRQAPALTPDP
jgi:hypothetical protein